MARLGLGWTSFDWLKNEMAKIATEATAFTLSERVDRLQGFVREAFERLPAEAAHLGLAAALEPGRTRDRRVGHDEAVDATLARVKYNFNYIIKILAGVPGFARCIFNTRCKF